MTTATNAQSPYLLVPDATDKDRDPVRLAKLVARLDSGDFGTFLDTLVAVDGVDWWDEFAPVVRCGRDADDMLDSLGLLVRRAA